MLKGYFTEARLPGNVSSDDFKRQMMIKQALENQKCVPQGDRKKSANATSRSAKNLLTLKKDEASPEQQKLAAKTSSIQMYNQPVWQKPASSQQQVGSRKQSASK